MDTFSIVHYTLSSSTVEEKRVISGFFELLNRYFFQATFPNLEQCMHYAHEALHVVTYGYRTTDRRIEDALAKAIRATMKESVPDFVGYVIEIEDRNCIKLRLSENV